MDYVSTEQGSGRLRRTRLAIAVAAVGVLTVTGVGMTPGAQAADARIEKAPSASAATPTPTGARECRGEPIMAAYYRTWRDVAATQPGYDDNAAVMSDIPPEVDIAFVFNAEGAEKTGYFEKLRNEYVPALHAQGTQLVRTLGIQVLLELPEQSSDEGYRRLADELVDQYMTADGLDGLDVDIERRLTPTQVEHVGRIFEALSERLGPASGTKDLLIYDTNLNGTEPLFQRVAPLLSYVLVQSYGRSVAGLQATWETYEPVISSCRYLIGFSFYEERGGRWGDTEGAFMRSRAAQYARWDPEGGELGGIFSYAVDRDWKRQGDDTITAPTYEWTQRLDDLQEHDRW